MAIGTRLSELVTTLDFPSIIRFLKTRRNVFSLCMESIILSMESKFVEVYVVWCSIAQ